ncbi:MAG: tRNA lysidine(34) synthetase TilS [Ruminococcaceae bacterium]|nr:tRNA lysidine(34) synthetase TilS [Oscillospiraceae bacterium]
MIENKVLEAIKNFNMLKKSKKVTVALSGGADSVCLLHTLFSLKERLGIELSAAHLNHMIRGEEADRDQDFVKKLCGDLGVPIFCERIDVPKYAKENSLSVELAARQLRYEFLRRVAGGGLIATAHNSGDNLETVLFNLTRGTAIKGLTGIPAIREDIIRPLIFCSRAEIEEYCKDMGLTFVTDSTNLCDDYTRNKIRHNIVPLLRELNPSIEYAVLRMGEALSHDSDYLEEKAEAEFKNRILEDNVLSLSGFKNLHNAVAIRVLKRFCDTVRVGDVSSSHLNLLYNVALSGGEAQLPKAVFESESGKLHLKSERNSKSFSVEMVEVQKSEIEDFEKINNLLLKNYIDCDKIKGKLVCRTRESGDSIKLKNKNGTKPLTKVYNEYRIPASIRDTLPVIADDCGVVWIYKVGVAERAATDSNSTNILKIKVYEGLGENYGNK